MSKFRLSPFAFRQSPLTMLMLAVLAGLLLTLLSFAIIRRSDFVKVCSSELMQGLISSDTDRHQGSHGFPYNYFVGVTGANCTLYNPVDQSADSSWHIYYRALGLDVLVWSMVASVPLILWRGRRRA